MSKVQVASMIGFLQSEDHFLGLQMTVFLLYLHMVDREPLSSLAYSYKGTNLIYEASTQMP